MHFEVKDCSQFILIIPIHCFSFRRHVLRRPRPLVRPALAARRLLPEFWRQPRRAVSCPRLVSLDVLVILPPSMRSTTLPFPQLAVCWTTSSSRPRLVLSDASPSFASTTLDVPTLSLWTRPRRVHTTVPLRRRRVLPGCLILSAPDTPPLPPQSILALATPWWLPILIPPPVGPLTLASAGESSLLMASSLRDLEPCPVVESPFVEAVCASR